MTTPAGILTVNGGSSGVKVALFGPGDPPVRQLAGAVERIGRGDAAPTAKGDPPERQPVEAPDPAAAAAHLVNWLARRLCTRRLSFAERPDGRPAFQRHRPDAPPVSDEIAAPAAVDHAGLGTDGLVVADLDPAVVSAC